MNAAALIDQLERFNRVLAPLVANVPDPDARWKPPSGAWSILEIVMHLADEETDDFRTRLRITLDDASETWPPIDPEGWAKDRRYNDANLAEGLARFTRERAESIRWLRSLVDTDWRRAYQHPKFGPIHAGDLLAAWAAHDALHLRQIAKRLFELSQHHAGNEFSTRYAGEWGS